MKALLILLLLIMAGAAQAQDARTQQLYVQGQRLDAAKVELPRLIALVKSDAEAARSAEFQRRKNNESGTLVLGADKPLLQFRLRTIELQNAAKSLLTTPPEQTTPQLIEMVKAAPRENELGKEENRIAFRASSLYIDKTLEWADTILAQLAAEVELYKTELTR